MWYQWQRVIILTRGEGYQYFPIAMTLIRVKGYQHVVPMAKGNNTNQRRGVPIPSNGNDTYQRVKGYQHVVSMAKGNNTNQRRGVPILSNGKGHLLLEKTLMFATGKDQNNSNQQCKFPKTCC